MSNSVVSLAYGGHAAAEAVVVVSSSRATRRRSRALDYPRWIVQLRVLARSARLWLTRRADGAHTSTDPPWRWWAPHHPVGWAARTHAARHAEIAEWFAWPELAHAHRLRFTSPRQAAVWLISLSR
jgi:hypothetical protein